MLSKIYSVKSNAARAAKTHGLKREHLIPVSGGWQFEVPEAQSASEPRTEAFDAPAIQVAATLETPISEAPSVVSEPIEWAGARLTVVNGSNGHDPEPEWQDFPPAAELEPVPVVLIERAPKRKRDQAAAVALQNNGPLGAELASFLAPEPEASELEAAKPKRSREPVPEAQRKHRRDDPNAKPAPKSGKTAELIAALRTDWQSVATMLDMTGWQRHTLRGYISRVAKHAGWILQRQSGDDWSHTMYRIRVK